MEFSDKILVIGAGGIGCELLKSMVLSNFTNITVIDLDTIDVSNLNRQFLFRKQHVGQSKAEVAADIISQMRPEVQIIGFKADVKKLEEKFFDQFALVINALDNNSARMHTNRICVKLQKPLIEAGTQGYNGQVSIHIPKVTACFECEQKNATQKTYPVWTIRSTPSEPVHWIVWAKYLFEILFGPEDSTHMMSDLRVDSTQLQDTKFITETLDRLFSSDIQTLSADLERELVQIPFADFIYTEPQYNDHTKISLDMAQSLLHRSISQCSSSPELGNLFFDKDDRLSMEFVFSASYLRMINFGIDTKTYFEVKEIAGNIIPAIASTNSIAASLQVIEAMKYLQQVENYQNAWISSTPMSGRLILSGSMPPPNVNCYVCSKDTIPTLTYKANIPKLHLSSIIGNLCKKKLGMNQPSVTFDMNILYEEGDDLDPEEIERYTLISGRTLEELKVTTESVLSWEDYMQSVQMNIRIMHNEEMDAEEIEEFGQEIANGGHDEIEDVPQKKAKASDI